MNAEAIAGVTDPSLRRLLSQHWEWTLQRWPEMATRLGDHRYDHQITDRSPASYEQDLVHYDRILAEVATVPEGALDDEDRVTRQLFLGELTASRALTACRMDRWTVGVRDNPLVWINELAETHPLERASDGDNLLQRLGSMPGAIASLTEDLREGLARDEIANAESVRRTIRMVEDALARPDAGWQLNERARGPLPGWSDAERERFQAAGLQLTTGALRPALRTYADFLQAELLPLARTDDHVGLVAMPGGLDCYGALIEHHTSLRVTPGELHVFGQRELARVHAEIGTLGQRLFGTEDRAAIFKRLREDPALYFQSAEEVEQAASRALERANTTVPQVFERLPATACEVRPIPAYEAPFSTIAYYMPPVPGEAPGYYYLNSYAPETRPRYQAEVLAFHESVPGHHTQIAFAQELGELPAFRRHLGSTAFIEGWALYVERLADELHLYSSDLDRMGMLAFDSWRSARLVVDTGIHAFGWSRSQAEAFMRENTPLAENNIVNEVDRYISWPGQALAYKVGQREILRLREESMNDLGQNFDIKQFHRVVLSGGAVSLPVLDAQVRRWRASASVDATR